MTKAALAIGLVVVLMVIAALYVVGGPDDARRERRDNQRQRDLQDMTGLIECLARENANRLPRTLQPTAICDRDVALNDPLTGAPYRYEVLDARSYRVCASYELPAARRVGAARKDCVTRRYIALPPTAPSPVWQ